MSVRTERIIGRLAEMRGEIVHMIAVYLSPKVAIGQRAWYAMPSDMQQVYCKDLTALHSWLQENQHRNKGVWLVFDKGAKRAMSYDAIVDELLCVGWIDSKPGKVSASRSKLWIAPRNPKSLWSTINKKKAENLLRGGRMQETGKQLIEHAKRTGSRNALDAVSSLEIPDDLSVSLQKTPKAQRYFDAFPPSTKKAILEWILNAKKPETRSARIAQTVKDAAINIRANQYRQPKGKKSVA